MRELSPASKGIRWLRRAVAAFFLLLAAAALSPGALYLYGLSLVEGSPEFSSSPAELSAAQKQTLWEKYGGVGAPRLEKSDPWSYALLLCCAESGETRGKETGLFHAAWAVRPFVRARLKTGKSVDWHVAWAAHAIWVSRHWSIDQILESLANGSSSNEPLRSDPSR